MALPPIPRPGAVNIARLLLLALAAMQLLSGLLGLLFLDDIRAGYADAYRDPGSASTGTGVVWTGLTLCVIYAAVIATPALLLGRPRQWVRVTTFVLAGLSYCCVSPQAFGGVSMASPRISSSSGFPSRADVDKSLADHLPTWYGLANLLFAVAGLLAVTGVIVLLALPASSAWFRKQPEAGPLPYGWPNGPWGPHPMTLPPTDGAPPQYLQQQYPPS